MTSMILEIDNNFDEVFEMFCSVKNIDFKIVNVNEILSNNSNIIKYEFDNSYSFDIVKQFKNVLDKSTTQI